MSEPQTIQELYIYIAGELKLIYQKIEALNNVDEKLDSHKVDCSAVKEIKWHKQNHWKMATIIIGISGLLFAGIEFLMGLK